MRSGWLGLLAVSLSVSIMGVTGCETLNSRSRGETPAKPVNTATTNGLAAQELAAGECAIFLWSSGTPRTFVFFHKQGEQNAKYYTQGSEKAIQTNQNTMTMDELTSVRYTYSGAGFETVILKGTLSEELQEGRRISNATLKTKKPGAWEEIHPVSGVYVCR